MVICNPRQILILTVMLFLMAGCAATPPGLRAYRSGDYAAAIKEGTPYAENGDAYSQWLIGSAYANAKPPLKDIGEAEKWINRAAEQGFVPAMLDMAKISSLYKTANDEQAAYGWYLKAAGYGNAEAEFMVGLYHYSATGGAVKDNVKAYTWWLLSAKQGHPLARIMLDKSRENISGKEIEAARKAADEWQPAKAVSQK